MRNPVRKTALVVTEASSLIEALTKISNEVFDLVLVGDQSALEPHDFLKSAREAAPGHLFRHHICVRHADRDPRQFGRGISWLHF